MRRIQLIRLLVAAVVLIFPATASADNTPPRAKIAAKAILVSPTVIILEVRLKCEEGEAVSLVFDVFQEQWGVGSGSAECTGRNQDVAISVFKESGWLVGDAQAFLNVTTSTDFEQEARSIRIES